ncbi:hypothetical protein PRZ48_006045 [Zasmidium cellare]|uniref:Heterokaryon incompatibility domain-containing protein n=1 Tax=Zasmidium cellare TaxID=395010 RepID=A0ABR0EMM4_ZASCE|nr:hypothetical protein PRZ48_006045 [Zasmidium cellare]
MTEHKTCPTCIFCDAGISCNSPGVSGSSKPDNACAELPLEIECPKAQDQQAALLYGSLEPLETWQIRILELQPGRYDAPLVGRLFNADILFRDGVVEHGTKRRYQYIAISYFWGEDQTPRHLLGCNGIEYPIPSEAYRALHRARDSSTPVCVWIDTVCINQHDERDKSSQVARMRYTYQYASKVAVYLGELSKSGQTVTPAEKGAKDFFDFLKEYWPLQSTIANLREVSWDCTVDGVPPMCTNHTSLLQYDLPEFLQLKWFNRIWVMQEVWAARSIEAHYGEMRLPWAALKSFENLMLSAARHNGASPHLDLKLSLQLLCAKLRRLVIGTPIDHAAADMDQLPWRGFSNLDQNILNVMHRSQGAEYSCVHDCIYGLLSMTSVKVLHNKNGSQSNGFFVSYAEHPATTFIRLAEYIIQRDDNFDLLLSSSAFPRLHSDAGEVEGCTLPSWVPDWRFPVGPTASSSWAPVTLLQDTFAVHGVLRCRGFILGAISSWCPYKETQFFYTIDLDTTVATVEWTHRLVREDTEPQYHAPCTLMRGDAVAVLEQLVNCIVLLRPAGTAPTSSAEAWQYIGHLGHMKDEEAELSGRGTEPSNTDLDYRALERGLEEPELNDLKVIDLV